VLALTLIAASLLASAGWATTAYSDTLVGTEVAPVSSTRGTFVGVATGQLPAAWRVQIAHEPLASGSTVPITGGTFTLVTRSRRKLGGKVTGGSVTVTNRGSHCSDQQYEVVATFSIGSFEGALTHHRRSVFGHCIVYAATIQGHGVFNV
jgi:hypothetical protein